MPLLFDALNIFSRKSRLASCAVSLASVSAAPKTPSSSTASGTLEVVNAEPELCTTTIQVEVAAGLGCMESSGAVSSITTPPRSPRRPTARHALLKCTVSPPRTKEHTLRRSTTSVARETSSSGHRRKRSSSTSSIAEKESVIAFPVSAERDGGSTSCSSMPMDAQPAVMSTDDARPPRKRARRSAVSTSRPESLASSSLESRLSLSLSSTLGLDDSVPTQPLRTRRSPSPPRSAGLRFTRAQEKLAIMYHTLIVHHEVTIPNALEKQSLSPSPSPPPTSSNSKTNSGFDPGTLALLRSQDSLLITRIYLQLLMNRVPVAPMQHDRLEPTSDALSTSLGVSVGDGGRDRCMTDDKAEEVDSPWIDPSLDDGMEVDMRTDAAQDPNSESEQDGCFSPSPCYTEPQYVGEPLKSITHLIAIIILEHRRKHGLRSRHRPRLSTSLTKSKLGLASVTLEDLVVAERKRQVEEALDGLGMVESMDVDVDCPRNSRESAVRSTFRWGEEDSQRESGVELATHAGSESDSDFDSDSDDDKEWKRLRTELVAGIDSQPTGSQPIPIRPPSPIPHQLDSSHNCPPTVIRRPMPIRDVTNLASSSSRTRKSSAGRRNASPSLRKPVGKIRYPSHALAVSK